MFGKIFVISIAILSLNPAFSDPGISGKFTLLNNACFAKVPVGSEVDIAASTAAGGIVEVSAFRPLTVDEARFGHGQAIETLFKTKVGHFYQHNLGSGSIVNDATFMNAEKFVYNEMIQKFNGDAYVLASTITLYRNGENVILKFKGQKGAAKSCLFGN